MAIIQSILVGKGRGKIGNVVLSGLKGQTVAKQLNSSPSNPRTVAQTDNRVKMANAVLAWQYLSMFFSSAKGLRRPLESIYNAFVRIVKNGLSDTLYESRMLAAAAALQLEAFVGNWFALTISSFASDNVTLSFSAAGVVWAESYRIKVLVIDYVSGSQKVVDVAISESDFNNGDVDIAIPGLAAADVAAAYIYDSAGSKISDVAVSVV